MNQIWPPSCSLLSLVLEILIMPFQFITIHIGLIFINFVFNSIHHASFVLLLNILHLQMF